MRRLVWCSTRRFLRASGSSRSKRPGVGCRRCARDRARWQRCCLTTCRSIADFDLDAATDLAVAMMSDEATRAHVCATLSKRAEHFTWERTVDVLLGHFDEVMRRPRNRARESLVEDLTTGQARRRKPLRRPLLEQQVTQLQGMTTARRVLAPGGSRRQSLLRTAVNWARVRADVADTRR